MYSKKMIALLHDTLGFIKNRLQNTLIGFVIALNFIPAFIIYLNGQAVNYTSYGLPKVLITLYCLYLLFTSSFQFNKSVKQILLTAFFMLMNLWMYLTGFYSLALFFGIGSLIIWSAYSEEKVDSARTLGLFFILLIILAPLISNPVIQFFRHISMSIIDSMLKWSDIAFQRNGTLYVIASLNVEIWERCSGYSTSRVFLILFSFFYFLQRKWLRLFLLTPFIAIGLGILTNVARIYIHLLFSIARGEELPAHIHELLGIIIFIIVAIVIGYVLIKDNPSFRFWQHYVIENHYVSALRKIVIMVMVFVNFVLGIYLVPLRLEKKLDHRYWTELNPYFKVEHHNSFKEWAGGGVWILFEHPIQYCYQYYGWQEGSRKGTYYRQRDAVTIKTQYSIADRVFENRFLAASYKMMRIDLFNEPIQVKIVITELKSLFIK